MQLASHPEGDAWKDSGITSIHADLEFEESYSRILDVVQKMSDERCLRNFTTLDCSTPERGTIDGLFKYHPLVSWHDYGKGCWAKQVLKDQS